MRIALSCLLASLFIISCKKEEPNIVYTNPAPVTSRTYSAEEIKGFYQLTVDGQFNNGSIKKLMGKEVYFYLEDSGYAHMNMELDNIIREINLLTDTNLILKRTYNRSNSLIQLHLTDRATYLIAEPASAGYFETSSYELHGLAYVNWGNDNLISHAGIFVDMNRADSDTAVDKYLLRHEITHALGFMGHTNMVEHTASIMFYYMLAPAVNAYDPFDKRMIQLLYNPAIKSGMNGAALATVFANL